MAETAVEAFMNVGQLILEGVLSLFYVALVLGATVLPAYVIWNTERRRLQDPLYLRQMGVVVRRFTALDRVADVIGHFDGSEIYRYVVFKGIRYDFDHVIPRGLPRTVQSNELFMEPGVVYLAA